MFEWEFIADPDLRDQCDHVWTADYNAYDDGRPVHAEWRCKRDGKYRKGDQARCGLHTPGVGRKGSRRVPKDPPIAKERQTENMNGEQNRSAHSILNNYHSDVVEAMRRVIETAHDSDELKIVGDLLHGSADHLLAEAAEKVEVHQ